MFLHKALLNQKLPFLDFITFTFNSLNASVASYRNQYIDLHSKSIDWFLYDGTDIYRVKLK